MRFVAEFCEWKSFTVSDIFILCLLVDSQKVECLVWLWNLNLVHKTLTCLMFKKSPGWSQAVGEYNQWSADLYRSRFDSLTMAKLKVLNQIRTLKPGVRSERGFAALLKEQETVSLLWPSSDSQLENPLSMFWLTTVPTCTPSTYHRTYQLNFLLTEGASEGPVPHISMWWQSGKKRRQPTAVGVKTLSRVKMWAAHYGLY